MITSLKGNIIEVSPTHVVIECNGVGYYLNISLNTFTKYEINKSNIELFYTYLSIKEDSHSLFGFLDKRERECFILLLSVSGVGASTARMILSSLTTKYRDLSYLISFGVQLLMYATPIVYPLSTVPAEYKIYISLNPMTSIIESFRQAFFGNGTL